MEYLFTVFPQSSPIIMVLFIIIGILFIRSFFRITFKLTFIASVIGFLMIVFLGYSPSEVFNKGKEFSTYTTSYVEKNIKPAIYDGLKNAHVEKGPNGSMELIGDHFEVGQTPEGKYIFRVNSLNLAISQDELAKYLGKSELEKLLQTVQDKGKPNEM